jgi:hypothetical protein
VKEHLVYLPSNRGRIAADLWGPDRTYDVAINDYTGTARPDGPEYSFALVGHKWPVIAALAELFSRYEAVCFLDDDVEIDTARLNGLFRIGRVLELNLWQAALTRDSVGTHPPLFQAPGSYARAVPVVEIMMPVFSRAALAVCQESFCESESGYGLDFWWPHLLQHQYLAVIDAIPARHRRPIGSAGWKLANGLTPQEECRQLVRKYNLRPPYYWRAIP